MDDDDDVDSGRGTQRDLPIEGGDKRIGGGTNKQTSGARTREGHQGYVVVGFCVSLFQFSASGY